MNEYPEHEKLKKVQDKSQAIGEFLDWLQNERHVVLAKYGDDKYTRDNLYAVGQSITEWLAEFYEINQTKLETEKRLMLEEMRHPRKTN